MRSISDRTKTLPDTYSNTVNHIHVEEAPPASDVASNKHRSLKFIMFYLYSFRETMALIVL